MSKDLSDADKRFLEFLNDGERLLFLAIEQMNKKTYFTFDAKTTEAHTYKLTEEEKARFKHLPTPCAVIGFKPKNINSGAALDKITSKRQNYFTQI